MVLQLHPAALTARRIEARPCRGSLKVCLVRGVAAAVAGFGGGAVRRVSVWRSWSAQRSMAAVRSWLCSGVVSVRSRLRATSHQWGGWSKCGARFGFLFGGELVAVVLPSGGWPNNPLEADAVKSMRFSFVSSRRAAQRFR